MSTVTHYHLEPYDNYKVKPLYEFFYGSVLKMGMSNMSGALYRLNNPGWHLRLEGPRTDDPQADLITATERAFHPIMALEDYKLKIGEYEMQLYRTMKKIMIDHEVILVGLWDVL